MDRVRARSTGPVLWSEGGDPAPVLVVDDSLELHVLIRHVLAPCGYGIVFVEHGREALAFVERQLPALILLDLAMPDLDGWTFLTELRRRTPAPVPVILCSAIPDLPQEAARLQAAGYLRKPFMPHHLRQIIRAHLPAQ